VPLHSSFWSRARVNNEILNGANGNIEMESIESTESEVWIDEAESMEAEWLRELAETAGPIGAKLPAFLAPLAPDDASNEYEIGEVAQMLATTWTMDHLVALSRVSATTRRGAHWAIREHLVRCEAHVEVDGSSLVWHDDLGLPWRACDRPTEVTKGGDRMWRDCGGELHRHSVLLGADGKSMMAYNSYGELVPMHKWAVICACGSCAWLSHGIEHNYYDVLGNPILVVSERYKKESEQLFWGRWRTIEMGPRGYCLRCGNDHPIRGRSGWIPRDKEWFCERDTL
jgi:hypothetical protein